MDEEQTHPSVYPASNALELLRASDASWDHEPWLRKFQIKFRNRRDAKLGQKKGDQALELCDNCRKASFINKVDALRKAAAQSTHGKSVLFSSPAVSTGCREAKTKWTPSLQPVREQLRLRKLFMSAPGSRRGGARENSSPSFAWALTPSHPSAELPFFPL